MISRFQYYNGAISLDGLGRKARALSFTQQCSPARAHQCALATVVGTLHDAKYAEFTAYLDPGTR